MKTETIEQYLDECLIHIGPYSVEVLDFDEVRINSKSALHSGICTIAECYSPETGAVLASSRESLKDWIMTAYDLSVAFSGGAWGHVMTSIQARAINNIESALPGRKWSEIKSRLEEIEEDGK